MFDKRLKQLREETGLTQEELAKKLNISRGTYAHYETGKREPNFETLQNLASFFEVSVDYLLGKSILKRPEERIAFHLEDDELDPDDIVLIQNLIESLKKKHKK